jgi:Na+/H+ antiporter NhaD/arsenite permease-like protein
VNAFLKRILFTAVFITISLVLSWTNFSSRAQGDSSPILIAGNVFDSQDQPIEGAHVTLVGNNPEGIISETETQLSGAFLIDAPEFITNSLNMKFERAHFETLNVSLTPGNIRALRDGESVVLPDLVMQHRMTISLWVAALAFVSVLILIASGKIHNTLAALVGASLIYFVSYLGFPLNENLFVFTFQQSLSYVDWNVIFLIMGMMIIIAVVENTGIFQWLAFTAYRISRGKLILLLPILMLITGVASAFLDNVTTMLLMTPISVQIALSLGLSPLVLLVPEVMASNVIGISTLIGTPTNILIGSYAHLSFNDFLFNLTPGIMLAFIGLVFYCYLIYRKQLAATQESSAFLLERLSQQASITEPSHLKKAGVVGFFMLIMFMFGEHVHLVPAVTALIGATVLMVWIRPNIEEMIEAVDWTTIVFFICLFILVGAIQEVGLLSFVAEGIGDFVGGNLLLAIFVVVWLSAILSMLIANIPFTAAMLPIVGYLTATIPGAQSMVLFYCLSVGSAMGGNGSLIGASANMVTAGIAERAGYPITYAYFMKRGIPALILTVGLATIWLLLRFL